MADAAAHWNLEYSSDPSSHMDHVLDTADLVAYPGDLALSPPPGFDTAHMGAIIPTVPGGVADLSGAVRILGTTTTDMTVTIDYNPLKLSESTITGMTFTSNADSGVTITEPSKVPARPRGRLPALWMESMRSWPPCRRAYPRTRAVRAILW